MCTSLAVHFNTAVQSVGCEAGEGVTVWRGPSEGVTVVKSRAFCTRLKWEEEEVQEEEEGERSSTPKLHTRERANSRQTPMTHMY